MSILDVIDRMSWKEFMIFFTTFLIFIHALVWILTKAVEKKLNRNGFVDGGLVVLLFFMSVGSIVVINETISKEQVINSEPIEVKDTVYQCRPILKKTIKYYDLQTGQTKPLEIEGCEQ